MGQPELIHSEKGSVLLFRSSLNFSVNFDSVELVVVTHVERFRYVFAVIGDLELGLLE